MNGIEFLRDSSPVRLVIERKCNLKLCERQAFTGCAHNLLANAVTTLNF